MIPRFRVWCTSKGRMLNVTSLYWKANKEENECLFANWWYTTKNSFVSSGDEVDGENFILMQSTGLFDKDGVEIFEGDLIKTTRFVGRADATGGFYEYDKDYLGVVKQLEGAWVIDTGDDAIYLWTEIEENEVLGNIWENPELLEVEK